MLFCTHNADVRRCPLCVGPEGPLDAKIAIVGARPGPDELAAKRPFIGWSGQLLFRLLGVPRETCYISNVRKDFSSTHSTPTESEIHAVLEPLRDELAQTQANVIIALGSQALYALTGKTAINFWQST